MRIKKSTHIFKIFNFLKFIRLDVTEKFDVNKKIDLTSENQGIIILNNSKDAVGRTTSVSFFYLIFYFHSIFLISRGRRNVLCFHR